MRDLYKHQKALGEMLVEHCGRLITENEHLKYTLDHYRDAVDRLIAQHERMVTLLEERLPKFPTS